MQAKTTLFDALEREIGDISQAWEDLSLSSKKLKKNQLVQYSSMTKSLENSMVECFSQIQRIKEMEKQARILYIKFNEVQEEKELIELKMNIAVLKSDLHFITQNYHLQYAQAASEFAIMIAMMLNMEKSFLHLINRQEELMKSFFREFGLEELQLDVPKSNQTIVLSEILNDQAQNKFIPERITYEQWITHREIFQKESLYYQQKINK